MPEHIKINNTAPWISYQADGTATGFSVPFPFIDDDDLSVWIDAVAQTLTTDFTVDGAGESSGGTITFVSAPADGASVVIARDMDILRTSDFLAGSALRADALNTELDRLTLSAQEQAQAVKRGLRAPLHDTAELDPLPAQGDRAERLLSFDSDGNPAAGPLSSLLDQVAAIGTAEANANASAVSAEANAAAAANSADEAADDAAGIAALVQNIPALTSVTGDGATTAFVLSATPVDPASLLVSLDGVIQHQSAFTLAGTTLTFASAPANAVAIEVRDLSSTAIVNAVDVASLAAIDDDVATVASIQASVTAVAADAADIGLVAADIANVSAVGGSIANVDAVAADLADIATVAADGTDIGSVASAIANVNAVAADLGNVNAVSGSLTDIATTATAQAEIASVAADIADVSTVAADIADVTTVADNITDVSTVATNIADVAGVAHGTAIALFHSAYPGGPTPVRALMLHDDVSGHEFSVDRASTANTRTDSGRLIQSVAANTVRRSHNPATGEPLGILVEPQRTNLVLRSKALNTSWVTLGSLTVTADQTRGPDGTLTLDKLVPSAASGNHLLYQGVAITAGDSYTFSGYFKAGAYEAVTLMLGASDFGSTGHVQVNFGLSSGTVRYSGGTGLQDHGIEHVGGGLYRCWISATASATTSTNIQIYVLDTETTADTSGTSYVGDGTSEIFGGFIQFEASSVPTSFIETIASQVTVDGDGLSLDPTLAAGFNPDTLEATLLLDLDLDWIGQNGAGALHMRKGPDDGGFCFKSVTDNGALVEGVTGSVRGDTVTLQIAQLGGWFTGPLAFATRSLGRHRIAIAWDLSTIRASIDGETVVSETLLAAPPVFDTLRPGSSTASDIGVIGHYHSLAYWPGRLSDSDLEALSTLPI